MKADDLYFTEPQQAHIRHEVATIKDLNNLSLRHLKFKTRQTQQEIERYRARIKYLRDKDEKVLGREWSEERRKSELDLLRKECAEAKEMNSNNRKKRQQERQRMIDLNLEDRFKKNSLRVYNGEMQKKERIKIASKIHKDLKEAEMQSQILRDTHEQQLKKTNQRQRKELLNSIARKKVESMVKKEHISQQIKFMKLKAEEKIRVRYESQMKDLIEREKIATERLDIVMKFREDVEASYFQTTGYARTHRSQNTRRTTRRLSEDKSVRLHEIKNSNNSPPGWHQHQQEPMQSQLQQKLYEISKQTQRKIEQQNSQMEDSINNKCNIFIS